VSPTLADRLSHINAAIDTIRKGLADQTLQSFRDDLLLRVGIERLLEIISEASRHIPPEVRDKETSIPWRRMADLGNLLRHAYHRVDAETLWNIARNDLEPLRVFVSRIVEERDIAYSENSVTPPAEPKPDK
jgi:uncharacterized protein with HEPN domain